MTDPNSPELASFIPVPRHHRFPIQNLPYGVFHRKKVDTHTHCFLLFLAVAMVFLSCFCLVRIFLNDSIFVSESDVNAVSAADTKANKKTQAIKINVICG
jgi:hypothetical protein